MLYVIFFGVLIAFILIALLRGQTPNIPFQTSQSLESHRLGERPLGKSGATTSMRSYAEYRELPLEALGKFCQALAKKHRLEILAQEVHQAEEVHLLTSFDHPLLRGNVIFCAHRASAEKPAVGSETVISFSDTVKAERAMKGVFITNGFFSEEVMKLNEGANIELVDVTLLDRWMNELTPELVPAEA